MGNRVETQDRLLAATRQIIINEDIEATSLEHICSVAGFTRGAFYSNFSSKDSLLGILAEAEYSDLIQRLRERGSPLDRCCSRGRAARWRRDRHHDLFSRQRCSPGLR